MGTYTLAILLLSLSYCRATEYLLVVIATNDQGFVKEVGECSADGANFGRIMSGDDSLAGCFVTASPTDACNTLPPAPTENVSIQCIGGFYLVAARGNCSFAQKAYRAQSANYKGIIIYNFAGYNYPIEMATDSEFGPRVRIPAFMVGYDCGMATTRQFSYDKGFAFIIRVYWSYHDLLRYLVPFVVVVGICFFVMLAAMLVKCIRDRRREMRRRLTKRNLKQIPTKKFVKGEDPETCPICLDDFEEGEKLRILPCGHAYHCQCIDPWLLKTRRVCPICKRKVLPGRDDSSDSDNDESNRRGAGTSRLASASERTPLLGDEHRNETVVGNSTFYGVYEPEGNTSPTPPLNRVRPILLSPASTPGMDDRSLSMEIDNQPLITPLSDESSSSHHQEQINYEGEVNPNFVEDLPPSANALTIVDESVPKGENV